MCSFSMSEYRIYYSGGGTCSSATPTELTPALDVQAIVQEDERVGWAMTHSRDYYVWLGDRWLGVDLFGLWDYLTQPGWKRALCGRTLTSAEFQAIYARAKVDRTFADKNGYLPGETHDPADL